MSNDNSFAPVILVISIICAAFIFGSKSCGGADHRAAEKEFKDWARKLDLKVDAVCNNHDGDGDGYVSCTYRDSEGVHTVECAAAYNWQTGCREQKLRIGQ